MNAAKLFEQDVKYYKPPSAMTWMPPRVPKPKTKAEIAVAKVMADSGRERSRQYMLHIYNVLELMEAAYVAGLTAGKMSLKKPREEVDRERR